MLFLIPPSEWKESGWETINTPVRSFSFSLPLAIAANATPKDLKCKDKRYEEGIALNKTVEQWPYLPAIQRYTGVMFKALDYHVMAKDWQDYANQHILIVSGMYGLLQLQDTIANYKLPVTSKWLYKFWWDKLTQALITFAKEKNHSHIIDLLPWAHKKLFNFDLAREQGLQVTTVNFYHKWTNKKLTHGVKKVKGEWIKEHCEEQTVDHQGEKKRLSA